MSPAFFILLAFATLESHFCVGNGPESHLICKQVEDVFEAQGEDHHPTRSHGVPGAPGKRGVPGSRGIQGFPGPVGPPGIVDYGNVTTMVNDAMTPVLGNLMSRLDEMDAKFEEIQNSISIISEQVSLLVSGLCEVIYESKCFWMIVHTTTDTTYSEAEQLCSKKNGVPANVYSEQNYNDLVAYARTQMPSSKTYYYLWTGMRINPSTQIVTLSSGDRLSFTKWHRTLPSSVSSYTRMLITVRSDPNSADQGMYNYPATNSAYGVICQR